MADELTRPARSPQPSPPQGRERDPGTASSVGRGWQLLFVVFLLALASLSGLVWLADSWRQEVPVTRIVVDGATFPSVRSLSGELAGYRGNKLRSVDLERIGRQVEAHDYVRSASVSTELNGIVRVRVVEREPIAIAVIEGRRMSIDRDGVLLPPEPSLDGVAPPLLQVHGIIATRLAGSGRRHMSATQLALLVRLLDALEEAPHAALLLREFHLEPRNNSWVRAAGSPTRFVVGNGGDFKEKLKKFEIFWQKVVSRTGLASYETVDLRFRQRVFASPDTPL